MGSTLIEHACIEGKTESESSQSKMHMAHEKL